MYTDVVSRIKASNVGQFVTLGEYVDVFDNYNSWRNAKIISIKDSSLTVTFDGWSCKYDETHKGNSTRVAYFRSHTEPYTGASKTASRDFVFQKEIDHIQQVMERMQKYIIEEFNNIEAAEVCQFIRGELYFLIDNILQEPNTLTNGDLKTSIDLIEAFIRFFVAWACQIQQIMQNYIAGNAANQFVFYFDRDTGLVACFPEMFDTLTKIFYGAQPRTKKYFQNNEFALQKLYSITDKYQGCHVGFFNYFKQEKGVECLEKLIGWTYTEDGEIKQRIPFMMIKQMLPVIETVYRSLNTNIRSDWIQQIKDMIFNRLQLLTPSDLKDNTTNTIFSILKVMPQQFMGLKNISQECECAEVKLAISLIKSQILDKKIKGIKELCDIVEKTQRQYGGSQWSTYFNATTLAKFLNEERLFEILLNEAQHAEVFKRAAPIMRFLAEQVNLMSHDIDQLWIAAQNRHEAEAKSVYEVISDISRVLPIEQLELLNQHIIKIPQADYDAYLITFIKDFTLNTQRNQQKTKLKNNISNTLQLMWDILQDKSQLPPQLIGNAMNSFNLAVRPEKEFYLQQCLENLRKGQSFPQSLQIMQKIIESYGQGSMWNSSSSEDTLHKIMKDYPMIDLIVTNLENYRTSVQITTDSSQILSGKLSHNLRIQYSIEFLDYISASPKKYEFTLENFRRLWSILVVNPVHDSDKLALLDMLVKGQFKFRDEIFKIVFCRLDYSVKQCYKSIEKYFYFVNHKNQSITIHKSQLRVCKYDSIVGLDFLFDVAFKSNESEAAIATLVNLHLRTEKMSQVDQKLNMWNSYLSRCKDGLKQPGNNISNIIKCIKDLVTGIEGKPYINGLQQSPTMTKFTIQIGKDEKTQKELQLPSNTTILGLRKYIAIQFNFKEQDYDFYFLNYDIKLQQESEEEYAISIVEESRLREKPDIIIQGLSQSSNAHFLSVRKFKTMLAGNSEIAEILFELLQSENYEDIWEVLTLMPQNKQIRQQLEKGANDEDTWSKILYFNCNKKLLYCLQIYEGMLTIQQEKGVVIDRKIVSDFIKTKGLSSLNKYYMKRTDNEFANLFNLKCFAQIAKIIQICQPVDIEVQRKSLKYILWCLNKIENKVYTDSSAIQIFLQNNLKIVAQEAMPEYHEIIRIGLLELQDSQLRKVICEHLIGLEKLQQYFTDYVMKENLSTIIELRNQAEQYIDFQSGILRLGPKTDLLDLAQQLSNIVLQLVDLEDTEKVLTAVFKLISVILDKCEQSRVLFTSNMELADAIIEKCLFQLPDAKAVQARCQTPDSRKAGYGIVSQLFSNASLMQIFDQYVQFSYWRTPSGQNWGIAQTMQQKSRTGYVGLRNLGCICYMNSLMQQLFTLPNFRDSVLQLNLECQPQSVLYQFQLLLSALKNSQKQYYDPKPFCNVLGPDNTPINTLEQMDVDEFWMRLMDKVESELKPLQRDMIIKKGFGGFLSTQFICKGCPHQSSRDELFLALSLQVKNKKNIHHSLQTMTDGEMLEGDNAYFCEKCEKKIPTVMRVCIKSLPNVLVVVLKRFEFNYETLQKFKLNDYYEFPTELNMKQYTYEHFRQQDKQDKEGDDEPEDNLEYPEEYYEYQLRGVIIHSGTADSGHYTSIIKDSQTGLWNEFNDTLVKPFDFNELASEAFGTDDKSQQTSKSGNVMNRQKNAYMVFYERKTYFDENVKPLKSEQDVRWYFNNNNNLQQKIKQNDEILQDNIKYQISQIMFEESFFDFSYNLLLNAGQYHISRYCLQYFLVVVVRSSDRSNLPKYLIELKKVVKSNFQLSKEFLISLTNKDLLLELLIQNPIQDMRTIISGLVRDAVRCISEQERNVQYKEFKQNSVITQLIQSMLYYIWELRNQPKSMDQVYRVLHTLSCSSENAKQYMREYKTVGRILLYFLEEPPIGAGYIELNQIEQEATLMKIDKNYIMSEPQPQYQFNRWDCQSYDYTYLICTLSELIGHLDDDEVAMLEDPNIIKKLFQLGYTKIARNALKNIYTTYIKLHSIQPNDPWTSSLYIVQCIYDVMKDCDEKDIRTNLVVLRGIAEIEDAYEEQRYILVAETMIVSLKDGLSYWYYATQIIDYILKICGSIKFMNAFRFVLNLNKSVLKLFQNWLKESQNPFQNFSQQRWKAYKRRQGNIQSNDITDKLQKFQQLAISRLDMLDKIMNQQIYDSGYDSDQQYNDFKPGSLIDIVYPIRLYMNNYENTSYQTWEIIQNIGDMVEIKSTTGIARWVYTTDSSIAPPNTQTKKYDNQVYFIK